MKRGLSLAAILLALAPMARAQSLEKTAVAIPAKALENGDRINIEAGFIKPTDRLKTYDDLFTNEYVK